jgi:hypothetical protein
MYNAFRSGGRVNRKRGVFDFEDEFGRDPIRDRYANTSLAEEDSESRVKLAASEMELAKASLEASMRPVQVMSDFYTKINSAATAKNALQTRARAQAQSAQAVERLNNVETYEDYTSILTEFPDAISDDRFKTQFNARGLALQTKVLGGFSKTLNSAATADEILQAQGALPVEVLADPASRERIKNLVEAAGVRVSSQRATQAASDIRGATDTDTLIKKQEANADVLSDPRVATATARVEKQLQTEQRLRVAGLDPSQYMSRSGEEGDEVAFNYETAEKDLSEIPQPEDIRALEGSVKRLSERKALAESPSNTVSADPIKWEEQDEEQLNFLQQTLDSKISRFYKKPEMNRPAKAPDDYFNKFRANME